MMKKNKAYTLIEVLVVLGIFAVLTILTTQSVLLTLRSARRAESSIRVRDDLNYRIQVIQRQLASANSITCTGSSQIDYLDYVGQASSFVCSGTTCNGSPASTMASGSASLDNSFICLTACSFTCSTITSPSSITVSLTGTYKQNTGTDTVNQTVTSKIFTHLND